ncbi:hypothetical protein JTE90_009765 [Oedothorax gibbosus]|uniref:Uncharacterized protein n=1 Tax=Oedothorax gibbosus TaxID=931172 RepID=A0AAV6V9X5_9ARAC|nr:hypothetical protein JTE90_009765 [Oedothorax gibbosus]
MVQGLNSNPAHPMHLTNTNTLTIKPRLLPPNHHKLCPVPIRFRVHQSGRPRPTEDTGRSRQFTDLGFWDEQCLSGPVSPFVIWRQR